MSRIGLLVYDVSLVGGAERVAINLANEFVKTNKVVVISVSCSQIIPKELNHNIVSRTISDHIGSISTHFLQYAYRLRKIMKEEDLDVLLAITAGVVSLAIFAKKGTKTKIVYCEHSNLENKTYGRKHELRQFIGARQADVVVPLTERDKNNFIIKFHVPENKLVVIPNWYTPIKKECKYNKESRKIISVGRLEKVKGYDYVIDCAKKVLECHPTWEWDIYGDGSMREELQKRINNEGIDRLHLKGNVKNLQDYFEEYAFLVMTSLYEGLPLSLLEAQSAMLPIISFDCPTGPSEIISNGENGILVPKGDSCELQKAIEMLIDSEDRREKMSSHAQDNINHYSKDRILRIWEDIITKTISQ